LAVGAGVTGRRLRGALGIAADWRVPLALAAATGCLAAGVSLPILQVSRFVVLREPFSIVDGVRTLAEGGDWLLAGIIASFSIVLPLLKIALLLAFWWRSRSGAAPSAGWLAALASVSRWAMLDVFVIALVIFAVKARAFADANVAVAIYPFLGAIALTAYAGRWVKNVGGVRR
jgi:paraquat-inducible protein A